jgi:hypothetical protein
MHTHTYTHACKKIVENREKMNVLENRKIKRKKTKGGTQHEECSVCACVCVCVERGKVNVEKKKGVCRVSERVVADH